MAKQAEFRHTAGPWRMTELDSGIFTINSGHWGVAEVERPADARLIAAAPELLQALEELIAEAKNDIEYGDLNHHALETAGFDMAKAAIQKATGE